MFQLMAAASVLYSRLSPRQTDRMLPHTCAHGSCLMLLSSRLSQQDTDLMCSDLPTLCAKRRAASRHLGRGPPRKESCAFRQSAGCPSPGPGAPALRGCRR